MADKDYQALYLKAQKVYTAATACYKELLQYQDVLDTAQLKAAKAAIEKAKLKCLNIKKKAQAQANLGGPTNKPIKITIIEGESTANSAPITWTEGATIQVKYRLENMVLPPDLAIKDPFQLTTTHQAFHLHIKANGKAVHLPKNLTVDIADQGGNPPVLIYTAVLTLPPSNESKTYTFQLQTKGKNGAGMSGTRSYQVSVSPSTPIEQPKEPETFPIKINIEPPTPAVISVFNYVRQISDFGSTLVPFMATI